MERLIEKLNTAIETKDTDTFFKLLDNKVKWGSGERATKCRCKLDVIKMIKTALSSDLNVVLIDIFEINHNIICEFLIGSDKRNFVRTKQSESDCKKLFHVYKIKNNHIYEIIPLPNRKLAVEFACR